LRDSAKQMWMAGQPPDEIANDLGLKDATTVRTWVRRYGWGKERERAQERASDLQVRRTANGIAARNEKFRRYFQAGADAAFKSLFGEDETGKTVLKPFATSLDAIRALATCHTQIRLIDGDATNRHEIIAPLIEMVRQMPMEAREALANRYIAQLDSADADDRE
jgi:hypothetical protein